VHTLAIRIMPADLFMEQCSTAGPQHSGGRPGCSQTRPHRSPSSSYETRRPRAPTEHAILFRVKTVTASGQRLDDKHTSPRTLPQPSSRWPLSCCRIAMAAPSSSRRHSRSLVVVSPQPLPRRHVATAAPSSSRRVATAAPSSSRRVATAAPSSSRRHHLSSSPGAACCAVCTGGSVLRSSCTRHTRGTVDYFVNLTYTIHNKSILQKTGQNFPKTGQNQFVTGLRFDRVRLV